MEVYNISQSDTSSCYVVDLHGYRIIFDPCIKFSSIISSAARDDSNQDEIKSPRFDAIEMMTVDMILLTHPEAMLSLPFIVREKEFRGKILCTDPVKALGTSLLKDLLYMIEMEEQWNGSYGILSSLKRLQSIYNKDSIIRSLNQVITVKYGKWTSHADNYVNICSYPSGLCLGGSIWDVRLGLNIHIGFISSMACTQTRYPRNINIQPFKSTYATIIGGGFNMDSNSSLSSSLSNDSVLGTLFARVSAAVKRGGNILIPCNVTSSYVLDVLPVLASYLKNSHKDIDIPIVLTSSVASQVLLYCSLETSWLSPSYLYRIASEEDPFTITELLKTDRIKFISEFNSMASLPKQSIIFAGSPTCRLGNIRKIIYELKDNPINSLIFLDPDYTNIDELLYPYLPITMQVTKCFFDPRMTYQEVNSFISETRPSLVFVPELSLLGSSTAPPCKDFTSASCTGILPSPLSHVIPVPTLKRIHAPLPFPDISLSIPYDVASTITITDLPSKSVALARIHATMTEYDGNYKLSNNKDSIISDTTSIWDEPSIDITMKGLYACGVTDAVIINNGINIPSWNARIGFEQDKCIIVTDDDVTKAKLLQIINKQVTRI